MMPDPPAPHPAAPLSEEELAAVRRLACRMRELGYDGDELFSVPLSRTERLLATVAALEAQNAALRQDVADLALATRRYGVYQSKNHPEMLTALSDLFDVLKRVEAPHE